MDLGILNTIIAIVIVLLVLSLLVQSVQTLLKKLFKLKSRQIENSLKDLYEQAIAGASQPAAAPPAAGAAPPAGAPPATTPPSPAEQFTTKVLDEFKKIGRVTMFGRPILDSLSKEDLFKVMGKMESENFFPDYIAKFQVLCDQIIDLRTAIEALASNTMLRGAASSKIAEIRAILAPIFNDVEALRQGTQVRPKILFADLLRLSKLNINDVLNLLDAAQQAITQEKDIAVKAGATGEVTQLQTLSDDLARIAKIIGDLGQKFDDAISPLRSKLQQVEVWFDTVTQSFDERYARHMRTASILISIVVVILLNANFFRVYKNLSSNQVQQNLIAASGPAVLEAAQKARKESNANSNSNTNGNTNSNTNANANNGANANTGANTNRIANSNSNTNANTNSNSNTNTNTNTHTNSADNVQTIDETRKEIAVLTSQYEGFGFTPLNWQSVTFWFDSLFEQLTPVRDAQGTILNANGNPIASDCTDQPSHTTASKGATTNSGQSSPTPTPSPAGKQTTTAETSEAGKCTPYFRAQSDDEWWASRRADVFTIFGWVIMVMLLSVGAPFWQDTLESLFGIKNLLRQKSATQNIETQSGTGQTKQ